MYATANNKIAGASLGQENMEKMMAPVAREMQDIEKALSVLYDNLNELETRLAPLMAPVGLNSSEQLVRQGGASPMAAALNDLAGRVGDRARQVRNMIECLEI